MNYLALRPGEKAIIYENDGELPPCAYVVALVDVPPFPGESHPECRPSAVVCAQQYVCSESERPGELLWGWVALDPDTKDLIGDLLHEGGAEPGRWYHLEIEPIE